MSDEQQRAFMLQASMKKLSSTSRLPKRPPPDRVKEALNERVFGSEKGFLQNSADFKNKMKVGSRVHFDSHGLPVADERDPVIEAARETTKANQRAADKHRAESITFPSLPDCPCCSMPTPEDELSRFGMCSQCKALEISSKAYAGPQMASKYTYDNGDAPFSSSWTSPTPPNTNGGASAKGGKVAEVVPPKRSEQSSSSGPRSSDPRRPPPPAAQIDTRRAGAPPSWSTGDNDNDRGESPPGAAAVPLRKGNGNLQSTTGSSGSHRNLGNSAPDTVTPPSAVTSTGSSVTAASFRGDETPRAFPRAAAAAAAPAENTAVDTKRPSNAKVGGGSDTFSRAPEPSAARASKGGGASRDRPGGGGSDGGVSSGETKGNDRAEVAVRKLSLEVAELRTLLVINRSALARVETMSKSATAPQPTAEVRGAARNNEEQRRDTAERKLARDVAELRAQLSTVLDKVSDSTVTPPSGRGGDNEVVQTMKREMAELRSQLDNARKETALTRSALRRLQEEVAVLQKKSADRR
ncbi:unnamed protein product [Ectocarpus fasciculatus]